VIDHHLITKYKFSKIGSFRVVTHNLLAGTYRLLSETLCVNERQVYRNTAQADVCLSLVGKRLISKRIQVI